jgi:hypothetical protein
MIAKLAKAVLKLIMPDVTEHLLRVFKLDQLVNYMELPNEADRKIEKLEEKFKMIVEDSHPPAIDLEEWDEVKSVVKLLKNKKAFKKLGK